MPSKQAQDSAINGRKINPFKHILHEWEVHRFDKVIEILSAVLLSLATVGTAWCSFQAARWSGVQDTNFIEAIGAYTDSAKLSNRAHQQTALHADLYIEWISALNRGEQTTADYLYSIFPLELKSATDAWLLLHEGSDVQKPASPFEMSEYSLAASNDAEEAIRLSNEFFTSASTANANSDNYVLLTVLFASVLFFGGISGKFRSRAIDLAMLVIACLLFLSSTLILTTYPVY